MLLREASHTLSDAEYKTFTDLKQFRENTSGKTIGGPAAGSGATPPLPETVTGKAEKVLAPQG